MIKRTAFIGAILSLIPFGQPLLIKTGVVLSTTGLMLSISENLYASDASFYFQRANKKEEEGNYYGAISDFVRLIEIDPKNAEIHFRIGNIKSRDLKDHTGALVDFNNAIKIDPNHSQAFISRSVVKTFLKDYYGAISDLNKAEEIVPNDTSVFFNRGIAKTFIGDKKGACSDWRKSSKIGDKDSDMLLTKYC